LEDLQQRSKGKEGTSPTQPKLTSGNDGVYYELGRDPDVWPEPFGDELRWQFSSEEEDAENGIPDVIVNLRESKVVQEVVGLGGS